MGVSLPEIAALYHVTVSTIKYHLFDAYRKRRLDSVKINAKNVVLTEEQKIHIRRVHEELVAEKVRILLSEASPEAIEYSHSVLNQ